MHVQVDAQNVISLQSGSNVVTLNNLVVRGASDPVQNTDLVTKQFLDTQLGDIQQDRIMNATNNDSKLTAN